MSNRGLEMIHKFNKSNLAKESEVMLMPEFGGWMVEAVPTKPYDSIIDPASLLSCEDKLHARREVLEDFFKANDLQMASLTNVPFLGTEGHIILDDPKLE